MILKEHSRQSPKTKWFIGFALILFSALFLKFYNKNDNPINASFSGEIISCDFEKRENGYFVNNNFEFTQGKLQTDEKSKSGRYSAKLEKEDTYGPTYIMKNPTPGKNYLVTIWSLNPHPVKSFLVVSGDDQKTLYETTHKSVDRNSKFWDKRELRFRVPSRNVPKEIKIYVYKNKGDNEVYFDDFSITEIDPNLNTTSSSSAFTPKTFNLILDKEAKDYFRVMMDKSIQQGTIFNDGTKTKAKINDQGVSKKLNLRLKGDWLDHIRGYPSYRIDMNSETSWEGMQSISIQEPHTRGFLREWVFFKFLDHADVLHPRYDFCFYKENNHDPVVFSYEEHFTKNLVEFGQRREGPILKLTEDRMWDVTRRTYKHLNKSLPSIDKKDEAYWLSEIRTFKEGKLLKNQTLMKNFELAHDLMHQYKYNLKPIDQIFDIERLAKYLALVDICLAHHAITWHNQRFYYNPVTSLLEPIGFDAFTPEDPNKYASKILSKDFYLNKTTPYEPLEEVLYDSIFIEHYFKYLNEYSNPVFLENYLNAIEEDIFEREKFIRLRHKDYNYNRDEIVNKAKNIRIALPAFQNSLMAFKESENDDFINLKLFNAHSFPLKVFMNKTASYQTIIFPQNKNKITTYIDLKVTKNTDRLFFNVVGIDSIHEVKILPWRVPKKETPRQKLKTSDLTTFSNIIETVNDKIIFKKGNHIIDKPLVFEKGKIITINTGTEIGFKDNGYIISYSPVVAIGDQESPIKINSLDGNAGSLTVLQADSKSILKHVEFNNQNTMSIDRWNLTGAVSFYESDVDITHVAFRNNQCEDALNIVRSNFTIDRCLFYNTFGDAFDADFCTGKITSCQFIKSGNDAIDVSGSFIEVFETVIDQAGDKGISAGEHSHVKVKDSKINSANIGTASKDLSMLLLDKVIIENCKTGLAAFQKKPEFGPASIESINSKLINVDREHMIEQGSKLEIK